MAHEIFYKNQIRFGRLAILLAAVLPLFLAGSAEAAIKPGALYNEGNLTLEAKNTGLFDLLQEIGRKAGIDIFVAKGFQPKGEGISLKIDGEPLEDVFRSLLRGCSYAAIYAKKGEEFRIVALKIYGEGQQGGEFVPLFSGAKPSVLEEKNRRGQTVTVLVNTEGDIVRRGDMAAHKGTLGPAQTEISGLVAPAAGLQEPWLAMQLQMDQDETERFADLLLLRKQAETAPDPQRKQSLSLVYADETAKFAAFKRANQNKIESLKRVGNFKEMNGK